MKQADFIYPLFGKEIHIIIYSAEEFIVADIMKDFHKEALRLQKMFNFFDSESELSRLNSARKLKVSDDLLEVVKKGLKFSRLTQGKYDITLGKRILQRKREEEETEIKGNYQDVKIKGNEISLNRKDLMIDLGSIAKGYITDRLADFLSSRGIENFAIDSRGDIVFRGNYSHVIEIQNPREKEKSVFSVEIKNQAIATSGDYSQFYKTGKSHIINQKELISVTVIADNLGDADVYATAIFVSDKKEREKMIKSNKKIKVLVIDENLKVKMYNKFEEVIKNELSN